MIYKTPHSLNTHLIYVEIIRYSNDLFSNEYALICIFSIILSDSSVTSNLHQKILFSRSKEKEQAFFLLFQERTVPNRMLHIYSILLNDCGSFRFLSPHTVQLNMMWWTWSIFICLRRTIEQIAWNSIDTRTERVRKNS